MNFVKELENLCFESTIKNIFKKSEFSSGLSIIDFVINLDFIQEKNAQKETKMIGFNLSTKNIISGLFLLALIGRGGFEIESFFSAIEFQ